MLDNFAIALVLLALLLWGEYYWFRQLNRRRSTCILEWIARAFRGHGSVGPVRWDSASCFHVELQLSSSIFRRTSLAVRLQPCDLLGWLSHRMEKGQETVTVEAELDADPDFKLSIQKHHWHTRTTRARPKSLDGWRLHSLDPMVLSTEAECQNKRGNVLDTLLATRSNSCLRVAFRKQAPQLVACVPLESLSPDAPETQMFAMLQELASSASASTP